MNNLARPLTPEEFARNFAETRPPLSAQAAAAGAKLRGACSSVAGHFWPFLARLQETL